MGDAVSLACLKDDDDKEDARAPEHLLYMGHLANGYERVCFGEVRVQMLPLTPLSPEHEVSPVCGHSQST